MHGELIFEGIYYSGNRYNGTGFDRFNKSI